MRGTQSKNNFAVFTPRREGFFCILVYTAQNRRKNILQQNIGKAYYLYVNMKKK